jgi:hypothetical protein
MGRRNNAWNVLKPGKFMSFWPSFLLEKVLNVNIKAILHVENILLFFLHLKIWRNLGELVPALVVGTMLKIPKFIKFLRFQISHSKTKSGSLSSILTFFGLNMANKRPHSNWWRYQPVLWGCYILGGTFGFSSRKF